MKAGRSPAMTIVVKLSTFGFTRKTCRNQRNADSGSRLIFEDIRPPKP